MRLGLYGGSFDPIHEGHVAPVRAARQALGLDQVIYLPTARPPHKPGRRMAPALSRFAMVEMALLGEEGLFASPFELTLGRPAYTIDTLEYFTAQEPSAELVLLIGSDSFLELESWVRWQEIPQLAHLGVLSRPGAEVERERLSPSLLQLLDQGRATLLAERTVDLSSTRLREILRTGGEPPAGTVSPLVLDYARKYGLYR